MSHPAIQILYGHFDVLLFTYGFPFTDAASTARLASNKDSSFLWKDALRIVPDQNLIFLRRKATRSYHSNFWASKSFVRVHQ